MRKKIQFFMEPAFQSKDRILILIRNIFLGINGSIIAIAMKEIIDGVNVGDFNIARKRVIIMTIMYLLNDLTQYFFRNAGNQWRRAMTKFLYNTYLGKLFTMDSNSIEGLGTGKTQSIIMTGTSAWRETLNSMQAFIRLFLGIFIGFTLIASTIGWIGFIVVISIFICSFLFVQYGNKIIAIYRKQKKELFTEGDRRRIRMIMSKNEIIQNNKIKKELSFIKYHFDKIYKVRLNESRRMIFTFDLQRITFTIIRMGIVIYAIIQIEKGHYTLGTLGLLWMLVNQIHGNIESLTESITKFHQDKVNIHKLRELFKDTPQIKGYDTGKIFTPTQGDIILENITYNYGKGEVLNDFSLHIIGGKKTALIGVSGSGKSTIIKLIAGYLYPQHGAVKVDNQELPNPENTDYVSLSSYYKHIGYLTQEPSVFDGTIYENLTYALDHEPTESEIQDAIQGAQCQFINEFPEGVQTQIGEKGIKLSGGQRQRLAIAKVLLKNPKIILLDEPTSALDSFSEEEVTKAFNNLFAGRTVIIIAHRLQTVKHADRIIVLEKGEVVEEGNHTSLVQSGGVYAKMLELQSGF